MHYRITHFLPCLPWWCVGLLAVLLLCLLAGNLFRNRRKVRWGYNLLFGGLDLLCGACVLVFVCQPMVRLSMPKAGSYRVILLKDCSASMNTHDGGASQSRLEELDAVIASPHPDTLALLEGGRAEAYAFGGSPIFRGKYLASLKGGDTLPGATPLGQVLNTLLDEAVQVAPIGALFLFSDGRWNAGASPIEAAKRYKSQGIPINCICAGHAAPPWDLSVTALSKTVKALRDETFTISACVKSGYDSARTVEVVLALDGGELERQTVAVPAKGEARASFSLQSHTDGFRAYTLRIPHLKGDSRPDNDSDYVFAEIMPPPVFRILCLQGGIDWEQRFLQQIAEESEQFQFAVITLMAKGKFHRVGLTDKEQDAFAGYPERTSHLEGFDAIVLDSRAASLLSSEALEAIKSFVSNKGGGLLVRGPAERLPKVLLEMMPMRQTELGVLRQSLFLEASQSFVYDRDFSGVLLRPGAMPLSAGTPFHFMGQLKRASRNAVTLPVQNRESVPVVSGIAYGAGRVAYCALEQSWRWRLKADTPLSYDAFWQGLCRWLAEAGKPRLRHLNQQHAASVGEDYALDLSVTGEDFLPAANATVVATVTLPNGQECSVNLEPQWEEEGRYLTPFVPTMPGEYKVDYQVSLPGETMTAHSSFVARQTSVEAGDSSINHALLKDLARITDGGACTVEAWARTRDFALSTQLPTVTTTFPLASSWTLFAIFAASACLHWWLRRRIGLV